MTSSFHAPDSIKSKHLVIKDLNDEHVWQNGQFLRLKPIHHRSYESVDLSLIDVSSYHSWQTLIDESIRALEPGVSFELQLKLRETRKVSRDEIMQQIFSVCEKSELIAHTYTAQNEACLTLGLVTKSRDVTKDKFTFGIVTSGKNNQNLERLVRSLETLRDDSRITFEIIVCGPEDFRMPSNLKSLVDTYLVEPMAHLDLPMTNLKKNMIAEHAKFPNLIISHDRYIFSPGVIDNLLQFGGDFDVCTFEAVDENNDPFPQWVSYSHEWKNSLHLDSDSFESNVYLNGGIFLVKRDILLSHPINPLLFWGYGEDIEWSRRMKNAGITPRLIKGKGLATVGHKEQYSSWFVRVPKESIGAFSPALNDSRSLPMKYFPNFCEVFIDDFISIGHAANAGLSFLSDVIFEKGNINFIPDNGKVAISLYLEKLPVAGIDILVKITENESRNRISAVIVGDKLISRDQLVFENGYVKLPFDKSRAVEAGSSSVSLIFVISGTEPFRFTSIQLGELPAIDKGVSCSITGDELNPYLISGWNISTDTGTWTNLSTSRLMLRFSKSDSKVDLTLHGRLMKNRNGLQTMKISSNSSQIKTIVVDRDSSELVSIPINGLKLDQNQSLFLEIQVSDPCSPSSFSDVRDDRVLGFELHKIDFPKSNLKSKILGLLS